MGMYDSPSLPPSARSHHESCRADNISTFEDNADHLSRNRIIYNTFSNSFVLSSPTAQYSLNDVKPSNIEEGYANRPKIPSDMFEHNSAAHETSGNTLAYAYDDPSRQPKVQKKLREESRTLEPLLKPPGACRVYLSGHQGREAMYLPEAVIIETHGLYPSVPGVHSRLVPPRQ